jgi:integrase
VKGSIHKRCSCPAEYGTAGNRLACKKPHGAWVFVVDAGRDPATGKRRQVKRGGFATKTEAEQALAGYVDGAAKGTATHDGRETVAHYVDRWLAGKIAAGLRPTTARSYRQHLDHYVKPTIGAVRLRDVRPGHVEDVLRAVTAPRAGRRSAGAASARRAHATLRSAFATAKRRRLIPYNPAADIDLPKAPRPKVQPWEPGELGAFLDSVASDLLGPLFEVMAGTGLRRGEALGLRWSDIDVDRSRAVVRQQIVQLDSTDFVCSVCGGMHRGLAFGKPKTSSGDARVVDLDAGLLGVLIAHRLRHDAERATWGEAYSDHGLVFARQDGTPIPPERVTKRFAELVKSAGLRPVRLHDLRHGQASLLLAAGVPLAVVSKRLGHSSLTITADTYSHLLEGVGRDAAERAAALVPRTRRDNPRDHIGDHSPLDPSA